MNRNIRFFAIPLSFLAVIAAISFFVGAEVFSRPGFYRGTLDSLGESEMYATELIGVTAIASAAITVLPDDIGTPIADKVSDLSMYFLIVLFVICLERYMLTICGYISFQILIPLACAMGGVYVVKGNERSKQISLRLVVLALVLWMVVPCGTKVSGLIRGTYKETVQNAIQSTEELFGFQFEEDKNAGLNPDVIGEGAVVDVSAIGENGETEGKYIFGWEEKIANLENTLASIKNTISVITSKLTLTNARKLLNYLIEAVVVTIVAICVLPVLTFALMLYLMKLFLVEGGLLKEAEKLIR